MAIYEVTKEVEYSPDKGSLNEKYVSLIIREQGLSDEFEVKMTKNEYSNDDIAKQIIKNQIKPEEIVVIKTYEIDLMKGAK